MSSEQLKFSNFLGTSSEANTLLVQRNESETKLLEEIRVYIDKRSKIDAEYADKISKLKNIVKIGVNTNEDDGFLHKVVFQIRNISL